MGFSPEAVSPSTSSSSSSSSRNVATVPASFTADQPSDDQEAYVAAQTSEILRCLKLTDVTGNKGGKMMTWKQVGERFDRIAFHRLGFPGRVVKWSDFAYCIGTYEMHPIQ